MKRATIDKKRIASDLKKIADVLNKTSGSVPITSLCEGAQTLKGYGSDIQVSADMGQVLFGLEWAELSPEDQEQLSALGFGPSAGEVALYL